MIRTNKLTGFCCGHYMIYRTGEAYEGVGEFVAGELLRVHVPADRRRLSETYRALKRGPVAGLRVIEVQ